MKEISTVPAYKGKLLNSIDNETNDENSGPVDTADTDCERRREDKARMLAMVDVTDQLISTAQRDRLTRWATYISTRKNSK